MTLPPGDDERISRLLRAVQAEADPALWTRARARIEAAERRPRGWTAWAMRPAALGVSLALLALALATTVALVATAPATRAVLTSEDLPEALVAELESATETGAAAGVPAPGGAADSGAAR